MQDLKKAKEHLNRDEKLSLVLESVPIVPPETNTDIYFVLLKSIVEQQLSVKSAAAIWNRFLALFPAYPNPELVMLEDSNALRKVGLSYQKAGYLKNIARFSQEHDISSTYLSNLDDNAATKHLTQIKGVGKWTAEMILMFSLGRTNVFPVDDLVIRNAMVKLYAIQTEKKALMAELEALASNWAPYRSYACYVLWDWYEGKLPPHIN